MQYKKDICSSCNGSFFIVNKKHYLCSVCNKRRLDDSRETKPKKKYTYKRKKTGERDLFEEIWKERPPYCEWCGEGIYEFSVANYHHIKNKNMYPELRLIKENIVKICFTCHRKAHS